MDPFDLFSFWERQYEMSRARLRRTEVEVGGTALALSSAHVLTMGPEGFVAYRGMTLDEIASYGWVERAIDFRDTPDHSESACREMRSQLVDEDVDSEDAWTYEGYARRLYERKRELDGWDRDDPDPRNPWHKENDDDDES